MSGTSIGNLTNASAVQTSDVFPLTQGYSGPGTGVTRKATVAELATAITPSLPSPYDVAGIFVGTMAQNQVLWDFVFVRGVDFPTDLSGSQAACRVAPTGTVALGIYFNGSSVGTITYVPASYSGTLSLSGSSLNALAGNVLAVAYPNSTVDATLADVYWTFKGTRVS